MTKPLSLPTATLVKEPSPDLLVRRRQQQQQKQLRKVWGTVNQSKCAQTAWFFKGKSKRVHLDSQGRGRSPSRPYTLFSCQVLAAKEKHLPPLPWAAFSVLGVSHEAVHFRPSQEGAPAGLGTARGNFELNAVTVYKIEVLIEKRNQDNAPRIALGDVSWLVSHLRLKRKINTYLKNSTLTLQWFLLAIENLNLKLNFICDFKHKVDLNARFSSLQCNSYPFFES